MNCFFSDTIFTKEESAVIIDGLVKFKTDTQSYLQKYPEDKKTRKNAFAKVDLANSSKNKIEKRISDFSAAEMQILLVGLTCLHPKTELIESVIRKINTLLIEIGVDASHLLNPPNVLDT